MKKGLKIVIILVAILVVLLIYFYFFHIFYTYRVCISNNISISNVNCSVKRDCIDYYMSEIKKESEIENLPQTFKSKLLEMIDKSVFCDSVCKAKTVYGGGFSDIEKVESCQIDEEEILLKIHGKDGLQLFNYLKKSGQM
ncbi:MAG: hypothetical protein QXP53_01850 [Candidatus Pacearchaeota archaeon]